MESFVEVLLVYSDFLHIIIRVRVIIRAVVFAKEIVDGRGSCWRKEARE